METEHETEAVGIKVNNIDDIIKAGQADLQKQAMGILTDFVAKAKPNAASIAAGTSFRQVIGEHKKVVRILSFLTEEIKSKNSASSIGIIEIKRTPKWQRIWEKDRYYLVMSIKKK